MRAKADRLLAYGAAHSLCALRRELRLQRSQAQPSPRPEAPPTLQDLIRAPMFYRLRCDSREAYIRVAGATLWLGRWARSIDGQELRTAKALVGDALLDLGLVLDPPPDDYGLAGPTNVADLESGGRALLAKALERPQWADLNLKLLAGPKAALPAGLDATIHLALTDSLWRDLSGKAGS